MSTFLAKPADIERKWYVVDAAGKSLGRTAVEVANLLRGKNKTIFTPNVDCGDHVIVINCKDAVLTGRKGSEKVYFRHTGWIGHLQFPEWFPTTRSDARLSQDSTSTVVQSTSTKLRSLSSSHFKAGGN